MLSLPSSFSCQALSSDPAADQVFHLTSNGRCARDMKTGFFLPCFPAVNGERLHSTLTNFQAKTQCAGLDARTVGDPRLLTQREDKRNSQLSQVARSASHTDSSFDNESTPRNDLHPTPGVGVLEGKTAHDLLHTARFCLDREEQDHDDEERGEQCAACVAPDTKQAFPSNTAKSKTDGSCLHEDGKFSRNGALDESWHARSNVDFKVESFQAMLELFQTHYKTIALPWLLSHWSKTKSDDLHSCNKEESHQKTTTNFKNIGNLNSSESETEKLDVNCEMAEKTADDIFLPKSLLPDPSEMPPAPDHMPHFSEEEIKEDTMCLPLDTSFSSQHIRCSSVPSGESKRLVSAGDLEGSYSDPERHYSKTDFCLRKRMKDRHFDSNAHLNNFSHDEAGFSRPNSAFGSDNNNNPPTSRSDKPSTAVSASLATARDDARQAMQSRLTETPRADRKRPSMESTSSTDPKDFCLPGGEIHGGVWIPTRSRNCHLCGKEFKNVYRYR